MESSAIAIFENEYIEKATAENTRIAYKADINHFTQAGFELPATPAELTYAHLNNRDHGNT